MKSIFRRKGVRGASTLPSSMRSPSPRAHHSRLWKPLPENSAAKRTGASLALAAFGSSPQTGSDSSHGSATVTPTPRRKVRRESWCEFIVLSSMSGGLMPLHSLVPPDFAELPAADNRLQRRAEAVIGLLQLALHLFQQRLVGKLHAPSQGVAEQFATELPQNIIAPLGQQVISQPIKAGERGAVLQLRMRVNRPAAEVLVAATTNGV